MLRADGQYLPSIERALPAPRLSVVVALISGKREDLARCLQALASQRGAPDFEVLVPYDDAVTEVLELAPRFLAAPVFAFLLLAQLAARVLARGKLFGRFLIALPLLVPVAVAYVWGMWLGYLVGPGQALERVE